MPTVPHFLGVAIKAALIKRTSENPNVEAVGWDAGFAPSSHPGLQSAARAWRDPGAEAMGKVMGSSG